MIRYSWYNCILWDKKSQIKKKDCKVVFIGSFCKPALFLFIDNIIWVRDFFVIENQLSFFFIWIVVLETLFSTE